jgi:hypothetical protein
MTTKFRIKMGAVEVDYEGTEEFLKAELPALLAAVSDLYKQSGMAKPNNATEQSAGEGNDSGDGEPLKMSTTTIATKLGVNSGPELALAAAVRLTMVLGKATFSRKEILDEMKSATGFYKGTYNNNLTSSLVRLTKEQKLNEQSKDIYALTPTTKKELETKLAG